VTPHTSAGDASHTKASLFIEGAAHSSAAQNDRLSVGYPTKVAGEPVSRILCKALVRTLRGDHSSRP
jgi:hypothetical protein